MRIHILCSVLKFTLFKVINNAKNYFQFIFIYFPELVLTLSLSEVDSILDNMRNLFYFNILTVIYKILILWFMYIATLLKLMLEKALIRWFFIVENLFSWYRLNFILNRVRDEHFSIIFFMKCLILLKINFPPFLELINFSKRILL